MKLYPEQAGAIELVYDEVAKVYGAEYSSTYNISAAVIGLLIKPVQPESV